MQDLSSTIDLIDCSFGLERQNKSFSLF